MQQASTKQNISLDQKGQSIFEFILLIFVVTVLGLVLLKGLNGATAERWRAIITAISRPTPTPIQLR